MKATIHWIIIRRNGATLKEFWTATTADADEIFGRYMTTTRAPKSARLQFEGKRVF